MKKILLCGVVIAMASVLSLSACSEPSDSNDKAKEAIAIINKTSEKLKDFSSDTTSPARSSVDVSKNSLDLSKKELEIETLEDIKTFTENYGRELTLVSDKEEYFQNYFSIYYIMTQTALRTLDTLGDNAFDHYFGSSTLTVTGDKEDEATDLLNYNAALIDEFAVTGVDDEGNFTMTTKVPDIKDIYKFFMPEEALAHVEGSLVSYFTLYEESENDFGFIYTFKEDSNFKKQTTYITFDAVTRKNLVLSSETRDYEGVEIEFVDCSYVVDGVYNSYSESSDAPLGTNGKFDDMKRLLNNLFQIEVDRNNKLRFDEEGNDLLTKYDGSVDIDYTTEDFTDYLKSTEVDSSYSVSLKDINAISSMIMKYDTSLEYIQTSGAPQLSTVPDVSEVLNQDDAINYAIKNGTASIEYLKGYYTELYSSTYLFGDILSRFQYTYLDNSLASDFTNLNLNIADSDSTNEIHQNLELFIDSITINSLYVSGMEGDVLTLKVNMENDDGVVDGYVEFVAGSGLVEDDRPKVTFIGELTENDGTTMLYQTLDMYDQSGFYATIETNSTRIGSLYVDRVFYHTVTDSAIEEDVSTFVQSRFDELEANVIANNAKYIDGNEPIDVDAKIDVNIDLHKFDNLFNEIGIVH